MKLIAKVKLTPDNQQRCALGQTLNIANQVCNEISNRAWEAKTFKQFDIHRLVYKDIRTIFSLSAQMTVRQIAKVADAYKLDKKTKRTFSLKGAISYDDRILSWKLDKQIVSIWTIEGRLKIPFITGNRQFELLKTRRGESDLCLIGNEFYLFATCDVDEPPLEEVSEFLGIDLGIKNIAVDSDGEIYSGSHLNNIRARYSNLRSKLQSKQTDSARRLLKKRSKKEANFANNTNHVISKHLVSKAKDTGRGIALEDLSGIRSRITVRKGQRRIHHSWAFYDLIQKIKYKAVLAGVQVILIDPRNTSRECSICGYIDKGNRPNQETFLCKSCGHSANADVNAARVIASRPAINRANVGEPLLAA